MAITPFSIAVPDDVLDDLRSRLRATRWPDAVQDAGWDYGTDLAYLRELTDYWADGFDWRAAEQRLNAADQVTVDVEGLSLHVVRQAARVDGAPTLLLLHGWPDSFFRFSKLMPLLRDVDLVVPSLPGYGFSERPAVRGFSSKRMAEVMGGLMQELGVETYVVHGGDIGSGVGEAMARAFPAAVRGLHLTDVPFSHLFSVAEADLSEPERAYLAAGRKWQMTEGAYALMQSTKPQTAAVGLNDSPAGLASWVVEKFRSWSDSHGDIESRFTKDELLTNLTIYWATQTIGSSFRVYFERQHAGGPDDSRLEVPAGFAIFPEDLVPAPRDFAERIFDVRRWSDMPRGGHFAALEEPQLLADEITAFIAGL